MIMSEFATGWQASTERHHVFRMTMTCPCCGTRWILDVTDTPDTFEIPDRIQLGLALLCGACEAQRITRYVVRGNGGKVDWSATFLDDAKIAQCWGRLRAVPRAGKNWITVEGLGPLCEFHGKLRDDRKDVLSAILTRRVNDYKAERVTCFDASQLAAAGLEWDIPKPPRRDAEGW